MTTSTSEKAGPLGPQSSPSPKKLSGWSNSPGAKFIIIGVITVLLLIPTLLVWGLVEDRSKRADQVAQSISKGWGNEQTINGPYLAVPYSKQVKQGNTTVTQRSFALVSAEDIKLTADVDVNERKRSIYSTPLYATKTNISGKFSPADAKVLLEVDGVPNFEKAFVVMGISDNSGFRSDATIKIDGGTAQSFEPGMGSLRMTGMRTYRSGKSSFVRPIGAVGGVRLPIKRSLIESGFSFDVNMMLNGSRSLHIVPAAKNSTVALTSNWPHPGFDGRFLPEKREITDKGFSAQWSVPYLARGIGAVRLADVLPSNGSVVTINFVEPLKFYQLITRTLKYAIAFFALIFLATFVMEQIGGKKAHWIQYILVGLSMIVFYVLLLALAEHIGFTMAYGLSSIATTVLIAWYLGDALASKNGTWIMGGIVGLSYLIVFLVMREQEFALLAGSLIAFAAIAATMYATRKVDWSGGNAKDA